MGAAGGGRGKGGGGGGGGGSRVTLLDPEQRVEEIARMLGGLKITETTRKHAAEMLKQGDL